jgi:hypothetical protein
VVDVAQDHRDEAVRRRRLWLSDLERWQARRLDRDRVPFDLLPREGAETPVSAKRNGSTR